MSDLGVGALDVLPRAATGQPAASSRAQGAEEPRRSVRPSAVPSAAPTCPGRAWVGLWCMVRRASGGAPNRTLQQTGEDARS